MLTVFLLDESFACKLVCLISTAWPSLSSQCFDGQSKRLGVTQQGVDPVSFCLRDEVLSVRSVEIVFQNPLDVCGRQRLQGVSRELSIWRSSNDLFKIRLPVPVCCTASDPKIGQSQFPEFGFDLNQYGCSRSTCTNFIQPIKEQALVFPCLIDIAVNELSNRQAKAVVGLRLGFEGLTFSRTRLSQQNPCWD